MDMVWCDVVDIDTFHLLLGRPWQHNKAATNDEENNTYNFMVDKVKFTLLLKPRARTKTFTRGWLILCSKAGVDRQGK
jgi:hypothetical protein